MIRPLACFLLLASIYLLYWPHAELVSDDWFHLGFYLDRQARGWSGELEVVRTLMRNQLYGVYELSWLSRAVDSVVVWGFGYAPRLLFTLAVLVHAANAWLFYRLLIRLRVAGRLALWAAAAYLLIPTAHTAVLWFVNNGLYHRPPWLLFLFLLSFVGTVEAGRLVWRAALWEAFLLVAIFSMGGAPSFYLALFAGPWIVLCFFRRDQWKPALAATAYHWVVVIVWLVVYTRWINTPPTDLAARYNFTFEFLRWNLGNMWGHLVALTGLTRAFYQLRPEPIQIGAAALAAGVVWLAARRMADARPDWRVPLFAAGMVVLASAPLWFLVGATLRHYYTVSPYLALLLVSLCARLSLRQTVVGVVLGWFAATVVADIRQCWAPQSRHLQALKAGLRHLKGLEPGDLVVVPGTPWVIGTAQNFALIIPLWWKNFAWHTTGVRDLEFWREVVIEQGRLRLYHRVTMRDTSPEELTRRTYVLLGPPQGPYLPARWWSAAGELRPLKGEAPGDAVYTPKPFDPHHPQHRLY